MRYLVRLRYSCFCNSFSSLPRPEPAVEATHFELLWSTNLGAAWDEHCMSSADEINKNAWWYVEPVILQAWGYVVFGRCESFLSVDRLEGLARQGESFRLADH